MVSLDTSTESSANICKLHYITLRHASAALSQIRERSQGKLSSRSIEMVRIALDDDPAFAVTQTPDNMTRNALVHYGLTKKFPDSAMSPEKPLFGIIEVAYPTLTFESFQALVMAQSSRLSEIVNAWSTQSLGR